MDAAPTLGGVKVLDLVDKAVLVAGASTGIGSAVARAFALQGARVAIHCSSGCAEAGRLLDSIAASGGEAVLVGGDLSADGASERVVEEAAAALGRLDGLVNMAGGMPGRVPAAGTTDERHRRLTDLDARSALAVTRAATRAARPWLRRQGGFVINTASMATRDGDRAIHDAVARSFLSTMTRGHAREFAADRIRVNAVAPGAVASPSDARSTGADRFEAQGRTAPMGAVGTAERWVGAYLFLASETLSGCVTGQVIEVGGRPGP